LVLTSDGNFRGKKSIPVKSVEDEALERSKTIKNVIVFKRRREEVGMKSERDPWWEDAIKNQSPECPAEEMDAEDMLFILYTSGSTGKPKGVVRTCRGYMVYAKYSFENIFQYDQGDVYWCTADVGWITDHLYIVYSPLLASGTSVMFEGIPTYSAAGPFWDVADK
jgi:acetyl-CoA synthetase